MALAFGRERLHYPIRRGEAKGTPPCQHNALDLLNPHARRQQRQFAAARRRPTDFDGGPVGFRK